MTTTNAEIVLYLIFAAAVCLIAAIMYGWVMGYERCWKDVHHIQRRNDDHQR